MLSYINKLLDLKMFKLKITQADHFVEIHIKTEPTLHTCPACNIGKSMIPSLRPMQTV